MIQTELNNILTTEVSMFRTCRCCGEIKELTEFPVNNKFKCKTCVTTYKRNRYNNNEKYRKYVKGAVKEYKDKNWPTPQIATLKCKAIKGGYPFDIVTEDVLELLTDSCPICKEVYVEIGERRRYRPSIDRIIPKNGYVKGNIIVVCCRCNRIKNDATPDELIMIGTFYKNINNINGAVKDKNILLDMGGR